MDALDGGVWHRPDNVDHYRKLGHSENSPSSCSGVREAVTSGLGCSFINTSRYARGSGDAALKLSPNGCRLPGRGFLLVIREERRREQPSFPPDGDSRLEEEDNVALVIDDYYPERLLGLFQVISGTSISSRCLSSSFSIARLSVYTRNNKKFYKKFEKNSTNSIKNLTGTRMYGQRG